MSSSQATPLAADVVDVIRGSTLTKPRKNPRGGKSSFMNPRGKMGKIAFQTSDLVFSPDDEEGMANLVTLPFGVSKPYKVEEDYSPTSIHAGKYSRLNMDHTINDIMRPVYEALDETVVDQCVKNAKEWFGRALDRDIFAGMIYKPLNPREEDMKYPKDQHGNEDRSKDPYPATVHYKVNLLPVDANKWLTKFYIAKIKTDKATGEPVLDAEGRRKFVFKPLNKPILALHKVPRHSKAVILGEVSKVFIKPSEAFTILDAKEVYVYPSDSFEAPVVNTNGNDLEIDDTPDSDEELDNVDCVYAESNNGGADADAEGGANGLSLGGFDDDADNQEC